MTRTSEPSEELKKLLRRLEQVPADEPDAGSPDKDLAPVGAALTGSALVRPEHAGRLLLGAVGLAALLAAGWAILFDRPGITKPPAGSDRPGPTAVVSPQPASAASFGSASAAEPVAPRSGATSTAPPPAPVAATVAETPKPEPKPVVELASTEARAKPIVAAPSAPIVAAVPAPTGAAEPALRPSPRTDPVVATAPVRTEPVVAAAPVRAPPAASPAATLALGDAERLDEPTQEKFLIQGLRLLVMGNINSARLLFERAADAGNSRAALLLGDTFDDVRLAQLGVLGVVPDRDRSVYWYERADELGAPEAKERLSELNLR
jgi:hypothetical protein